MRYRYTPIRMAKIQNTGNTKSWWGCGATGAFIHCWECKMVQLFWKIHRQFLTKLNIPLSYDPAIVSSVFTQRSWKRMSTKKKKNLHKNVYSSFIHNCQNLELTKMSFSRLLDKQTTVHSDNGLLLSAKKTWAVKPWKDMEEN